MSGSAIPNHTSIPNDLFDRIMSDLSGEALKVCCALIRLESLGVSETDVEQLASRSGMIEDDIIEATEELKRHGLITCVIVGNSGRKIYSLAPAAEVQR